MKKQDKIIEKTFNLLIITFFIFVSMIGFTLIYNGLPVNNNNPILYFLVILIGFLFIQWVENLLNQKNKRDE